VRRRAFALSILLGLAGCATGQAPIQPAYTPDELRASAGGTPARNCPIKQTKRDEYITRGICPISGEVR